MVRFAVQVFECPWYLYLEFSIQVLLLLSYKREAVCQLSRFFGKHLKSCNVIREKLLKKLESKGVHIFLGPISKFTFSKISFTEDKTRLNYKGSWFNSLHLTQNLINALPFACWLSIHFKFTLNLFEIWFKSLSR